MKSDYIVIGLIVLCVVVLTVSVSMKQPESFTELYFTDHLNLQKYSDGNFEVRYTIHNLENKRMDYDVKVLVDDENGNLLGIYCNELVPLNNNGYASKICRFKLDDDFKKVKVRVNLVNQEQEIHFWSTKSGQSYYYPDFGYARIDCLNKTNNVNPGVILINAKGDYAGNGWPVLDLYVDGKKVTNVTINSGYYKDFTINYPIMRGTHVIDLVFVNDYYDSETKADRNLYFREVTVGGKKISNYVIDRSPNAFDCDTLDTYNNLYSLSSIRFKVNVQ